MSLLAMWIIWIILGQSQPPPYDPSVEPVHYTFDLFTLVFGSCFGCAGWLYFPLMIWMVIYCVRTDPERYVWLWIILLLQPFGPIIYLLARWLPNQAFQPPQFLRKWTRGKEIQRLRIAAHQIGNAHQFVELGDALRETGRDDEAADAYAKAMEKDGDNLQALWGAACVDYRNHRFAGARDKLATVIDTDPAYKFGDVSLLYGKTLHDLKDIPAATEHLEQHTRRWRHPEGLYMLADCYAQQGRIAEARSQLNALIEDLDGSPRAIARKHIFWKGRARRMLRRLPAK
jgi:hypothetical protein